jgi:hypothetical protein
MGEIYTTARDGEGGGGGTSLIAAESSSLIGI